MLFTLRLAVSIAAVALVTVTDAVCFADVVESPNGSGIYIVTKKTSRSHDEVMQSFSKWRNSTLLDRPNLWIATWSVSNGALSEKESSTGSANHINLKDLDLKSLHGQRAGTWQLSAKSISARNGGFTGRLRLEENTDKPEDARRDLMDTEIALQALQDIYDLAYIAQKGPSSDTPPLAAQQSPPSPPAHPNPAPPVESTPVVSTQEARPLEKDDARPPLGKKVPALIPLATTPSLDDSCPYPGAARESGETGTVLLLVHVGADGSALDTAVEQSSGSDVLDQAAAACVKSSGRFATKRAGGKAVPYWGHMKFNWTFGE